MKIAIFLGAGASAAEHCPIQSQLFVEYFFNTAFYKQNPYTAYKQNYTRDFIMTKNSENA